MRSTAIGILIVLLSVTFLQPMIETANVFKEKVALGAAILNCCRAAFNYALVDDVFDDGIGSSRDLDAVIDKEKFVDYFANAFGKTFDITLASQIPSGDSFSIRFSAGERWNEIEIQLDFEDMALTGSNDWGYDLGYNEAILNVTLETPYVFRTKLLQQAMAALPPTDFNITESRQFVVRVIN